MFGPCLRSDLEVDMRQRVTTLLEVCGLAVAVVGLGMIAVPVGVVAAGTALILIGWTEGAR